VRVISIRCSTGGAEAGFGFFDAVPAPHADLVAAFAGVELFVGDVEFFAA
jgi:hypothetical protein